MPHPPYEILEHTADVGIKAYGRTLPELFVNAARGMIALALEPPVVPVLPALIPPRRDEGSAVEGSEVAGGKTPALHAVEETRDRRRTAPHGPQCARTKAAKRGLTTCPNSCSLAARMTSRLPKRSSNRRAVFSPTPGIWRSSERSRRESRRRR